MTEEAKSRFEEPGTKQQGDKLMGQRTREVVRLARSELVALYVVCCRFVALDSARFGSARLLLSVFNSTVAGNCWQKVLLCNQQPVTVQRAKETAVSAVSTQPPSDASKHTDADVAKSY